MLTVTPNTFKLKIKLLLIIMEIGVFLYFEFGDRV